MEQDRFAKEVIKALDEKSLSVEITDQLALARKKAIFSKKEEIQVRSNMLVKIWNYRVVLSLFISLATMTAILFFSSLFNNYEKSDFEDQDIEILTDERDLNFWLDPKFHDFNELHVIP